MSWTEEKQETPSMNSLISENIALKLKLEEAKSIMNEQKSLIEQLNNKQTSLIEIEEMQKEVQLREKKLTEKEEIIEEGLSKLKAIKPNQATYNFDFSSVASPAFNIINDSKRTFTGGVSNLKYDDLRKILDIIIQLRDHGQEIASMVEETYRKNKTLMDGGVRHL